MQRSEASELVWAALDAYSIAQTLDRMTAAASGLSARELGCLRAQAWAIADRLQSLVESLPASWACRLASASGAAPGAEHAPERRSAH